MTFHLGVLLIVLSTFYSLDTWGYLWTYSHRMRNNIAFKSSKLDIAISPIIDLPERDEPLESENYQEYLRRTTVKIQNKLITPPLLRNLQFTDVDGNKRKIATNEKVVVVFLRHLGCPYCWSYIKKWCDRISELKTKDIEIAFISIGDKSNLPIFLELNPTVPRKVMFVDEEQGGAGYTDAGFTKLFEDKDLNLRGLRRMKPPDLSFQQWITWISNTGRLSPKNEGVLRLGGTFAIDRDSIIYAYEEGMLGDSAVVDDVMFAFEKAKFQRLKVIELKAMCRDKGLKVGGIKADLIKRLLTGDSE